MRDSCYVSVIPVWAYSDNVKIKLRVFIGEKKIDQNISSPSYHGYQNLSGQYLRTSMLSRVF